MCYYNAWIISHACDFCSGSPHQNYCSGMLSSFLSQLDRSWMSRKKNRWQCLWLRRKLALDAFRVDKEKRALQRALEIPGYFLINAESDTFSDGCDHDRLKEAQLYLWPPHWSSSGVKVSRTHTEGRASSPEPKKQPKMQRNILPLMSCFARQKGSAKT